MRLGVAAAMLDGELVPGDVEVVDGLIARAGLESHGGGTLVPGFVDLQVNGFGGIDLLSEPERVGEIDAELARLGVLAWQPTLITAREEHVLDALPQLRAPGVIGVHLEGPFLAPARAGTHPVEHLREPDVALLRRFLAAGDVSMVTLAPELPGALELVDELVAHGVAVSMGHTDATADEARAAVDRGVRAATHVFNAMRPLGHRDPGAAGVALTDPRVGVMAIADGVHLAPEALHLAWRTARGRFAVVTDAIAAAGVGDGGYRLGEVPVTVEDGVCRRADGVLAGSVATIDVCLRQLAAAGVPFADAVAAVTTVPARIAGRPDLGRLRLGAPARGVVLDDGLEVLRVVESAAQLQVT